MRVFPDDMPEEFNRPGMQELLEFADAMAGVLSFTPKGFPLAFAIPPGVSFLTMTGNYSLVYLGHENPIFRLYKIISGSPLIAKDFSTVDEAIDEFGGGVPITLRTLNVGPVTVPTRVYLN